MTDSPIHGASPGQAQGPNPTLGHVGFFAFISLLALGIGLVEMEQPRDRVEWIVAILVVAAGGALVLVLSLLGTPPPDTRTGRVVAWIEDSWWIGPLAGGFAATLLGGGVGAGALMAGLPVPAVVGFFAGGVMGAGAARLASLRKRRSPLN